MGIKTAIHEQNAFPGVTNKILAKSADVVMLTVKEAEKYMPENAKTVVTGLPVRGAFNTMSKSEAKNSLALMKMKYVCFQQAEVLVRGCLMRISQSF